MKDPDKAYATTRQYRADNPLKESQWSRAKRLKSYGISEERYGEIFAEQNGGCAICHFPGAYGKRLAIDHDHDTGKVRGLLCVACNLGIGSLRESRMVLLSAAQYLTHHGSLKP